MLKLIMGSVQQILKSYAANKNVTGDTCVGQINACCENAPLKFRLTPASHFWSCAPSNHYQLCSSHKFLEDSLFRFPVCLCQLFSVKRPLKPTVHYLLTSKQQTDTISL